MLPPTISQQTTTRQKRHTEAFLLLFVLLLLALGVASLLVVKAPNETQQKAFVNVNRADAATLARALAVSPQTATIVLVEQKKRGGFEDVDALKRLRDAKTKKPIVPAVRVANAESRLIVRDWPTVRTTLIGQAVFLALAVLVAHILLRRAHPNADPYLLPVALFLSTLGILLLFALKDPLRDQLSSLSQTRGLILGGLTVMALPLLPIFGRLPLHRYIYVYALFATAGAVVLAIFGSGPGGVKLSVAGTQPVEFIKVLMVFFLAAYLAERGELLDDPRRRIARGTIPLPRRKDILPLLALYSLPLLVFAIVRDLGPALLLFGTFLLLLYVATNSAAYVVAGFFAIILGGVMGYTLRLGVFETRVNMFLSPWSNTHSGGDQLAHGLWALSSGGVFGSGLGLSGGNFVPRGGSDLVFATLGEELGLVGALATLIAFLILIWRGVMIAQKLSAPFERYLAFGLAALLGLQTLVILWGNLGLFPLTGITLPFVAYGRSSLVATFFTLGVLIYLSARTRDDAVVPPAFIRTVRASFVFFLITLGVVGGGRLLYIQVFAADYLMSRTVTTPDADRVRRSHVNPRLLTLASRIARGKILDRNGATLAETRTKRIYPLGAAAGHLVGYSDLAVGGPSGLEKQFDGDLRGFNRYRDLCGFWRYKDFPGIRLPQGRDIRLTLDAKLQTAAFNALKSGATATKRAAVVVLDAKTGGVLAAATLPAYDPNLLTPARMATYNKNADKQYILINRALRGYYPPGSTFKIVTASALLASGKGDFTTNCRHIATRTVWRDGDTGATYSRRRIVDDEGERAHADTDLTEAVRESCNIYFARAGIELGGAAMRDITNRFGFAKLPPAFAFSSELPDIAYGQGPMLATPLEMASVAQTIANNGTRITPTFFLSAPGAPPKIPVPVALVPPTDAAALASMMAQVTQTGTAAGKFRGLPFAVAGKTGTAQNDRYNKRAHGWFIGFAPVENPRFAFAVVVENGGYGGVVAAPIARAVLQAATSADVSVAPPKP